MEYRYLRYCRVVKSVLRSWLRRRLRSVFELNDKWWNDPKKKIFFSFSLSHTHTCEISKLVNRTNICLWAPFSETRFTYLFSIFNLLSFIDDEMIWSSSTIFSHEVLWNKDMYSKWLMYIHSFTRGYPSIMYVGWGYRFAYIQIYSCLFTWRSIGGEPHRFFFSRTWLVITTKERCSLRLRRSREAHGHGCCCCCCSSSWSRFPRSDEK